MTPKDLEDIRSWRRGEWVADITEIESMVYGLVDEIDRLRAAADGLMRATFEDHENSMLCRNVTRPAGNLTWHQYNAMGGAFRQVLIRGRELGLWK